MYQVLTHIVIQQIPSDTFPDRKLKFTIPFLASYTSKSTWQELTQTLKLTLPKRVKYRATDEQGNVYSMASINRSIGGYVWDGVKPTGQPTPTFMRGDLVTFNIGWRTQLTGSDGSEVTYMTGGPDPTGVYPRAPSAGVKDIPVFFQGFISKISPRQPFVIECEDAMWLLKQVPTPSKQWPSRTLQGIAHEIIEGAAGSKILQRYQKYGVSLTVSKFSTTDLVFNVQNFWTKGESLASTLGRVKHQYKLDSWFRGFELRIGLTHYLPADAVTQTFTFQKNILDSDSLSFQRKDDTILSCVVKSHYDEVSDRTTKDGKEIRVAKSTEILVFNSAGQYTYIKKQKGVEFPPNLAGQRLSLQVYDAITDTEHLFQMGVRYLKKYYYDGLKGSFNTFGIPYVKHGDVVKLVNPVLPEMDGMYMVKSVEGNGGAEDEGLFQTIELDYKINTVNDIASYIL